ncbi:methyltransferase [Nocardioides sp. cx-173]|uniref:methyltransferase n=1 Tax=Nocardioides sp. cx-173 TaxID=2898796 RepID=UPI001E499A95|nr:methyltransferase [Nocardioides sp. cx-173]MCD4527185.1 methyltransferase [Nocardioides sp. cx-173]UGB40458.1 methyltransferase [Nocardioides sp. cx-173]
MDFSQLTIEYDDRVLTPRPWTAMQSQWAAELIPDAPVGRVLELCAGAGHIGLLAVWLANRPLVCVDLNPAACELTQVNASMAGLADDVEVHCGDLAEVVPSEQFGVVIADPPWVPAAETQRFPEDPLLAIDGGEDGLSVARLCLAVAAERVADGGHVLIQLGSSDQAQRLSAEGCADSLRLVEIRDGERGVVARFDRVA